MDPGRPSLPQTVLVAGCGYVGARLAELLAADGVAVWGLKRDPSELPGRVRPIAADVSVPASLEGLPRGIAALVYAVAPAGPTEEAYRAAYVDGLRNVLAGLDPPAGRLILVSSTGVYGQDDGRWVDEETDPEPADETAARILEGEAVALAGAGTASVVRLGGIYGPGRTRTVRVVLSGDAPCPPPDVFANRIHRDDAAAALRHVLGLPRPASIYLGVDRDPAPLRDVYRWIAARAGAPDPCRDAGGEPPETAMPRGRRSSNKRCSSRRLVESGFTFRYPTFRDGYGPLVDELAGPEPRGDSR
jgi:nucleoside-diphosphate-sugar epimerase